MKKYKTSFSNEELHSALHSKEAEAKDIISDEGKWEAFKNRIIDFIAKAEKLPVIGGMIDDIRCMVCMVDSYVKKEYKEIPLASIISIVAALVYVLSPIDLIPDFIPFAGYLDDAAVIILVLNFGVDKDLDKYRKWNENNRQIALSKMREVFSSELKEVVNDKYLAALIVGRKKNLKLILNESAEVDEWSEYYIKEIDTPIDLLVSYSIEEDNEILKFINETIELNQIPWVKGTEKHAYLEMEFNDKWDDYIIKEGE